MAETAHHKEENKHEYFDLEDVLDKKISTLAELISTVNT